MEQRRLTLLVSLRRPADIPAFHDELSRIQARLGGGRTLAVHFPARFLPTGWGRVSMAQPAGDDPLTLGKGRVEAWKAWAAEGRILPVPAGWAGARLPALDAAEQKAELSWCVSNEGKSGFADAFGAAPAFILPDWSPCHPLPDLPCPCAVGLTRDPTPRLVFRSAAGEHRTAWHDAAGSESAAALSSLAARLRSETAAIVFARFDFSAGAGQLEQAAELLENLSAQGADCTAAAPGGEPAPASDEELDNPRQAAVPLDPDLRAALSELAAGRRGRATRERLRTQLENSLAETPRLPVQAAPAAAPRSLLANMEGETALLADGYEARFSAGSWLGFFAGSQPAAPAIRIERRHSAAERFAGMSVGGPAESSVSFDTDRSRGLRAVQRVGGHHVRIPGEAIVDYLLTDSCPHLLLDCTIRYPWVEAGGIWDEAAPCVLPVELPADFRGLRATWSHGGASATRQVLPATGGDHPKTTRRPWWKRWLPERGATAGSGEIIIRMPLAGDSWHFDWEEHGEARGLDIERLPAERGHGIPLEIRLRRRPDHRHVLEICPEGRYDGIAAERLRSVSQHFVVAVHPRFGSADIPPPPGDQAAREFTPFWQVRES